MIYSELVEVAVGYIGSISAPESRDVEGSEVSEKIEYKVL